MSEAGGSDARVTVDAVLVNYRSAGAIWECVRSWSENPTGRAHRLASVVVVDNDPGALDDLAGWPELHYIRLDRNRGYASAVNEGWRATNEPYVLLLNPDARIALDSIDLLAAALDANPDTAAVAPLHLDPENRITNPYHRLPSWLDLLAVRTRIYRFRWAKRRAAEYFMNELDELQADGLPIEVPQPPASCLMVRRIAIGVDDPIDERFPFLFSDVDLSRRLATAGWRTLVVPTARCWHVPATAGRYLGVRNRAENHVGAYRYARKWEPRFGAELFRAGLLLELALTARRARDVRVAFGALIRNESVFDKAQAGQDPVRPYWPSSTMRR